MQTDRPHCSARPRSCGSAVSPRLWTLGLFPSFCIANNECLCVRVSTHLWDFFYRINSQKEKCRVGGHNHQLFQIDINFPCMSIAQRIVSGPIHGHAVPALRRVGVTGPCFVWSLLMVVSWALAPSSLQTQLLSSRALICPAPRFLFGRF